MQKISPLVILIFSCFALPAQADVSLTFGLYTSDKPSDMVIKFSPVLRALEKDMQASLGEPVKIKMKVSKTYEEGVGLLVAGKVDFSRFGPASYVTAKRQDSGLSILALESVKGKNVFYGIIAVHSDSEIKAVADLSGKTFAFGSEKSTIGRYLSQLYLSDNGIKASSLSKYNYLGRHDKVGEAVAAQLFDAGALKEKTFKKLLKAGKPLRELARFSNVSKPWIARNKLDPIVREALHSSLLGLTDKAALKRLKIAGFLDGNDKDYDTIRRSMDRNHDFFE
jgi:phosphonate transport system substrate-binding protein